MLKKVIDILKFVINKYELKHPEYAKPVLYVQISRQEMSIRMINTRFRKISRNVLFTRITGAVEAAALPRRVITV